MVDARSVCPIQDCTVLRSIPPYREVVRDDIMIVMSAHNDCVEYQQLQRAYEDAIVVWEEDRLPNVRPINRQKLTSEEAAELRHRAMTKLNMATNDLYTHLKTCATCNSYKKRGAYGPREVTPVQVLERLLTRLEKRMEASS